LENSAVLLWRTREKETLIEKKKKEWSDERGGGSFYLAKRKRDERESVLFGKTSSFHAAPT